MKNRYKAAIMCSGGDAPGMNAALKKFVEYMYEKNAEPYFVHDGLEGLIDGRIRRAEYADVSGILHRGGTVIGSSRSKRFYEYRYRKKAFENLKEQGIDAVVVLGGDGSFSAMERISKEFPIRYIGIPATIDNDIYGTEKCIGTDTALNVIRDALDKIRDTASAISRAFVVEVMGRDCGYLAIVSAITSGAEICVVPEADFNRSVAGEHLRKEISMGRRYILAIVAEGTEATTDIAEWLEHTTGMETRITVLGHIQRGGSSTVFDRLLAFEFTVRAVDAVLSGTLSGVMTAFRDGRYGFVPISEVVRGEYSIDPALMSMLNRLD